MNGSGKAARVLLAMAVLAVVIGGAVAPAMAAESPTAPQRAELQIWQPHYVDSNIGTDDAGNLTVYSVTGNEIQIQPRNFDAKNVTKVRIEESKGTIRYDAARNVYVFNAEGTEGTFTVYWTVKRSVKKNVVRNNTTTTATVQKTVTYGSIIKTRKTGLSHVQSGVLKSLRSDAENWSEVQSLYSEVGAAGKPIEKKLQLGANLVAAMHNPVKALKGDFGQAVQTLFFSAGGLLVFILTQLPNIVRNRRLRKENKDLKEKIGDYEDIDDALDDIFSEKRKRWLREQSFNDWFDDRTAAWLRREVGPNPWAAFRRIMSMVSPAHLNSIVAGAMLDTGDHVVLVERDEVAADGGTEDEVVSVATARLEDANLVDEDDLEDGKELLRSSEGLTEEIVGRLDVAELDSEILRRGDVDLRSVALPVANHPDDDDFVQELNVNIPTDFETREHFAEVLLTLIQKVEATDYATDDGEIRADRDLANLLMSFGSVGGEAYGEPYLRYFRDLMIHNVEQLDASKRTKTVVEEKRDRHQQQGSGS